MTFLGFLFLLFVVYLAYRLIFDFIIPVYRTTKRVRKSFREMSDRMNQYTQHQQQENYTKQEASKSNNTKSGIGDYIDFEEIKD